MELKLLQEVRETTNKNWALADSKFKQAVEQQLSRRAEPSAKGGDRKSKKYRETVKSI